VLFVHDDRTAPYLRCEIRDEVPKPLLIFPDGEPWRIYQILVPAHPKVRLSFLTLRRLALRLVASAFSAAVLANAPLEDAAVEFENWTQRGHDYVKDLLQQASAPHLQNLLRLGQEIAIPRYLAIVKLGGVAGRLEVLLDTTATEKNMNVIAIVNRLPGDRVSSAVATELLGYLRLPEDRLLSC
jgi:hypothetical protein